MLEFCFSPSALYKGALGRFQVWKPETLGFHKSSPPLYMGKTRPIWQFVCACFLALGGHCLQMLCSPGFGTHAKTRNLPHVRAFPASIQELSGRHRGIASLVFSHHGSASQRISAARTRIARSFASHRIAISCLARIIAHIASLPASRDMGHSVQEHSPPKCLIFVANAKLPNRPGFAHLLVHPPPKNPLQDP